MKHKSQDKPTLPPEASEMRDCFVRNVERVTKRCKDDIKAYCYFWKAWDGVSTAITALNHLAEDGILGRSDTIKQVKDRKDKLERVREFLYDCCRFYDVLSTPMFNRHFDMISRLLEDIYREASTQTYDTFGKSSS